MDSVTTPFPLTQPRGTTLRFAFIDVARALAVSGIVIMNYHAYLNGSASRNPINASIWDDMFNPDTGFFTTRFAALFVTVAGVAVTFMSQNRSKEEIATKRVVILRRGILLAFVGGIFEWIWPGSILYYYGAYFLLGAALIRAKNWVIVTVASTCVIAATAIQTWRVGQEYDGHYTGWLDPSFINSPRELLLRTFVGYTHPIFPWFAFFCIGLLLGRAIPYLPKFRKQLLTTAIALGGFAYALREIIYQAADSPSRSDAILRSLASTDPFDRGILYTVSASAIAVTVIVLLHWWCDLTSTNSAVGLSQSRNKSSLVNALQRIGQFTFTIYIGHALFFNLVVYRLDLVANTGLDTALVLSAVFLALAFVVALWWTHIIGQGPIERCYRWLTGS